MNIVPWRTKKQEDLPVRFEEDFGPLQSLRSEMNRLIDRFFGESSLGSWRNDFAFNPTVDVEETEDHVVVTAEVPGVDPNKLDVSVCGRMLTVSGEKAETSEKKTSDSYFSERRFGSFKRVVQLPSDVTDDMTAEHKNGVLKIKLKKAQTTPTRKIPISAH